jgi:hypothetical protein
MCSCVRGVCPPVRCCGYVVNPQCGLSLSWFQLDILPGRVQLVFRGHLHGGGGAEAVLLRPHNLLCGGMEQVRLRSGTYCLETPFFLDATGISPLALLT